ncbi:MAG TPA: GFA family protein [Xanthobacteraceae bacterium]|jgi:hypothetical protein|nr:GFA family protein [Xanthobacteraceae bacterium]
MSEPPKRCTGGCLCGALRYEASGAPEYMGHCYCEDCRKASGSGFIPFIGFAAEAVRFTGKTLTFASTAANGNTAVRNSCPVCGSLVFGGELGKDASHTIYAGTLDDPSLFQPTVAIFTRGRPDWAVIPAGLQMFERSPQG